MPFDKNDKYGSDFRCAGDIDPALGLCSGTETVINDCIKRLSTPALFWNEAEGIDLTNFVNMPLANISNKLSYDIRTQLARDIRVAGSEVTTQFDRARQTLTIRIDITISNGESFTIVGDIGAGYTPNFVKE